MRSDGQRNPEYATSFADWVFHQTYPAAAAKQAATQTGAAEKERGRIAHQFILESVCKSSNFLSVFRRSSKAADWNTVYIDNGQSARTFVASNLLVDTKPVRCRPDLVLKHKATGKHMIIEYKSTRSFTGNVRKRNGGLYVFDADGYPNNRAQLWCYSQIDEFRDREPLLILQFRDAQTLKHKVTIAWRSGDRQILESRRWFERYGGQIVTTNTLPLR